MQESGVPNVTSDLYGPLITSMSYTNGFVKIEKINSDVGSGGGWGRSNIYLHLNWSSNQYQSINEVRVKSIISNGFIKLY